MDCRLLVRLRTVSEMVSYLVDEIRERQQDSQALSLENIARKNRDRQESGLLHFQILRAKENGILLSFLCWIYKADTTNSVLAL